MRKPVTHSPKTTAQGLSGFVRALGSALGLPPLQPWQSRFLDALDRDRMSRAEIRAARVIGEGLASLPFRYYRAEAELDPFCHHEPERDGLPGERHPRPRPRYPDLAELLRGDLGRGRPFPEERTVFVSTPTTVDSWLDPSRFSGRAGDLMIHGGIGEPDPEAPVWIGIDHGLEQSVSISYVRQADGRMRMLSASIDHHRPARDRDGAIAAAMAIGALTGPEIRLVESVDRFKRGLVSLSVAVNAAPFARSIARLRRKVEIMRYQAADRRGYGTGADLLQGRIYNAFHERQRAFGAAWIEAADRYAELQDMHLELYGERWPRPTPDQAAPF